MGVMPFFLEVGCQATLGPEGSEVNGDLRKTVSRRTQVKGL